MIPHIKLLASIIILITGVFSLFYTHHVYKVFPERYLKPFLGYILLFNVFEFLVIGMKYYELNMFDTTALNISPLLKNSFFMLMSVSLVGMAISMIQTASGLLKTDFKPFIRRWAIPSVALALIVIGIDIKWFEDDLTFELFTVILYTSVLIYFFELPALLVLYFRGRKESEKQYKQLILVFSILYLSRYVLLPIIALFPDPVAIFKGRITVLYANLIPIIWIRFYFLEYAKSRAKLRKSDAILSGLVEKYNISKRELEILTLILDGKSNKEIKTQLFISYHTVKNHIYNLFQKLGVKSRYELMRFLNEGNNS